MSEGRQILGASVARWTASLTTTAWKCVGAGGRRDPCGLRDARLRSQRGTGRGLPHDDPSAGGDPPGAPRAGQAPPATAAGADRQGLLLVGQPGLAVLPPHPYPRSRSGPTRPSTVGPGAHAVGAHRSSTPLSTRTVMPWNAASATSSTTGPWLPGTTSSPCATGQPPISPASTTGSNDLHNRP